MFLWQSEEDWNLDIGPHRDEFVLTHQACRGESLLFFRGKAGKVSEEFEEEEKEDREEKKDQKGKKEVFEHNSETFFCL